MYRYNVSGQSAFIRDSSLFRIELVERKRYLHVSLPSAQKSAGRDSPALGNAAAESLLGRERILLRTSKQVDILYAYNIYRRTSNRYSEIK